MNDPISPDPTEIRGTSPPSPLPVAKPKVLIVDDTPANLQAFEATLESLNVDLVLASSGREALGALLHEDFAVILLDVRMPLMDGLETAALIRKRQHTPIIFVSAYEKTPVEVAEGYLAGAIDYLFSPVDPETLKRKVAGFVEVYIKTAQAKREGKELGRLFEVQKLWIRELEETVFRLRQDLARLAHGQPS